MRISDWSSDVCSSDLAPPARAGSAAFIETQIDDEDPYVQQSVGYTLRLYYATPLVSGQLDQAKPDGASLQRVGSDLQYTRLVGGKRYTVGERSFLLVPERSGPMKIGRAACRGRVWQYSEITGVVGYLKKTK